MSCHYYTVFSLNLWQKNHSSFQVLPGIREMGRRVKGVEEEGRNGPNNVCTYE
jgi:hypothetical protein